MTILIVEDHDDLLSFPARELEAGTVLVPETQDRSGQPNCTAEYGSKVA
jgi:hypothetical protein